MILIVILAFVGEIWTDELDTSSRHGVGKFNPQLYPYQKCGPGFFFHAESRSCLDVDECAEYAPCPEFISECRNLRGSFTCDCHPGYYYNGLNCLDRDECEGERIPCEGEEQCVNTPGSFRCLPAPSPNPCRACHFDVRTEEHFLPAGPVLPGTLASDLPSLTVSYNRNEEPLISLEECCLACSAMTDCLAFELVSALPLVDSTMSQCTMFRLLPTGNESYPLTPDNSADVAVAVAFRPPHESLFFSYKK